MQKVIGVTELQRRFRSVFDEVVKKGIPYVLTRGSRPEAVLIPYETFLRYQELEEKDVQARFDRLLALMAKQNDARSDEEVAADREAALARFEALSRRAGLEAEAEDVDEAAPEAEIEAIKREVFEERYGRG